MASYAAAILDDSVDEESPFAERIRELKRDRAAITDGTDPDLRERLKDYDRARVKRLKSAKLHYQYQLKYVEALYKFQEQEANNVFNEHKTTMQAQMAHQINEQLTKYVKIRDSQDAELRVSTRKLRSQHKQEEEAAEAAGQRKSRYGNGEEAPINFAITPAEIAEDLTFIQKDYVQTAKAFMAAAGMAGPSGSTKIPMVRIENGVLIVDDVRYHTGDRISLVSDYTGEDFHGTVTSINSSEMYCRLIDGSKARVYLKHLRNCRVSIRLEDKRDR